MVLTWTGKVGLGPASDLVKQKKLNDGIQMAVQDLSSGSSVRHSCSLPRIG